MFDLRIKLGMYGLLGAAAGIGFSFLLMAYTYDSDQKTFFFDTAGVWLYIQEYFNTLGRFATVFFKLMAGMVAGMCVVMFLASYLSMLSNRKKLAALYASFDLNSRYVVAQRTKETLLLGIVLLVVVAVILVGFRLLHSGIDSTSATNPFPMLTIIMTSTLSVVCTYAAMFILHGVLVYGSYSRVPITIRNRQIEFFKSFYRLPLLAIDQPISVSLDDAEIDFDSQSKGSMYVSSATERVVISPRLEFVSGSFDELADYLEKFAVEDETRSGLDGSS